jgi:micrococcal nuclease
MKRSRLVAGAFAVLCALHFSTLCQGAQAPQPADSLAGTVTHVYDGDTVKVRLDSGEERRVRLIGIDAPEYDAPQESSRLSAFLARRFAYSKLYQKPVRLTLDKEKTDAYGRLLAYVWTDDRTLFNEVLVTEGYAYAYLKYPFDEAYKKRFQAAEAEARREEKGLWRKGPYPVVAAAEAAHSLGRVVTVTFRCVRAFDRSRYRILVPAEGDFEAVVPLDVLSTFPGALEFENRAVEVTGLVEEFRGRPQIMIGLPAQVKVSDFRLTAAESWII